MSFSYTVGLNGSRPDGEKSIKSAASITFSADELELQEPASFPRANLSVRFIQKIYEKLVLFMVLFIDLRSQRKKK